MSPEQNTSSSNTSQNSSTSTSPVSSRSISIPITDQGPNQDEIKFTIRVLTLNCWGLWLGAKKRSQRMASIVRYLRETNCDIVFLQEVWITSDFENIRDDTRDIYRFAHLFRSGSVLGSSGIVILCKWWPKVIHFEPYSLNGSPFYPWHGDWFAGKGIAYVRVDFDGLSLHLFSTHTHAYYNENESVHDQYSVHRMCQSYQLARFINFISDTACNRKADGKDLLIVAGDMNCTSSELPYKIVTTMAGLTDCFKTSWKRQPSCNIIHKHKLNKQRYCPADNNSNNSSIDVQGEKVRFCSGKFGENYLLDTLGECKNRIAQVLFDSDTDDEDITYCHPKNSFTSAVTDSSSKKERTKKSPMKRIDFILCRLLTHGHCVVDRIATAESKDPTSNCSLSDHEPVMVELKISDVSHDLMDKNHIVSESPDDCSEKESNENSRPLAAVVESKTTAKDASQIEETTNLWVPGKVPVNLTYPECNVQVMESTQDILKKYYQYNRTSKTQLFYVVSLIFMITLPTTTYYALINELMPISTIVIMWLAASFLFAVCLLIGFLSYRFEQGAIEAILNDITCKISVSRDRGNNNFKQSVH